MIYLQLFWEFAKIGLFAVGGGMATLPFLERLSEKTGWFEPALIADMVAISESTPGPIGINMATYVGCDIAGIWGGIVATMGLVAPALLVVILVSMSLEKFRGNQIVDNLFYGLRPAVTAMIAAAGIGVAEVAMFTADLYAQTGNLMDLCDIRKLIYCVMAFIAIRKIDVHPVVFIGISAVVGIVLGF